MRFVLFLVAVVCAPVMGLFQRANAAESQGSAYDYSFKTLHEGSALPLSQFKGKVLLVVNTASKCGFTPQYEGLEKLYETYKDKGLVIVGVPSNDFGEQEPGNAQEIANFCKVNYGVSFPMTEKEVVVGDAAHPFYQWAATTLGFGSAPKWNFHKYLVDRQGKLVDFYFSNVTPESDTLVKAIEKALAQP